jgi:hypothetical protein
MYMRNISPIFVFNLGHFSSTDIGYLECCVEKESNAKPEVSDSGSLRSKRSN